MYQPTRGQVHNVSSPTAVKLKPVKLFAWRPDSNRCFDFDDVGFFPHLILIKLTTGNTVLFTLKHV